MPEPLDVEKLVNEPPVERSPKPYYQKRGDMLRVFWEDVESHGEWTGHGFTLHRRFDTNAVVGITIDNVAAIIAADNAPAGVKPGEPGAAKPGCPA